MARKDNMHGVLVPIAIGVGALTVLGAAGAFLAYPPVIGAAVPAVAAFAIAAALMAALAWLSWQCYREQQKLRQALAQQAEVESRLRSSELRYRLVVDHAPFPVLIGRVADGVVLFANPAACRALAVEDLSARTYHLGQFFADMPPGLEAAEASEATIATKEGQGQAPEIEVRARDGNRFWAEVNRTPMTYDDESCLFVSFTDVTRHRDAAEALQRMADTDMLTGLANRRKFLNALAAEMAAVKRHGRPASVISMDLDRFKYLNDRYGHLAGDAVLTCFADGVGSSLRVTDTFSRIGGEEFAILLRETALEAAAEVAESIRVTVAQLELPILEDEDRVTVSIGCTEIAADDSVESLMRRVDARLYGAKRAGRNRVDAE